AEIARARETIDEQVNRLVERDARQIREQEATERRALIADYESRLERARAHAGDSDREAGNLRGQLNVLESSRGVRAVKLARASRAVLKYKGPRGLAKQAALWTIGKRGYNLRDIVPIAEPPVPASAPPASVAVAGATVRAEKLPKQPAFSGVSIIIPVFNALEYTKACVESVYRTAGETPFEIIIIDNGSRPDVLNWLQIEGERHDSLWYVSLSENLGFSKAVNLGIRTARGQHIVLLNSDTVPTTDWLDNLVAAAEGNPQVGIVSPVTNYIGQGPQVADEARDLEAAHAESFAKRVSDRTELLYAPERLVFFCVLIKRQVVNLLGGLDEGYGLGNYEDEDYSVRARLAGFKLAIAQNSFVYHHGSKTFAENKIDHTGLMVGNYHRYLNMLSTFSSLYIPGKTRAKVEQPEVSVIVRTVNRPDTLAVALTSRTNQTFDNFEVVVVN
ncbi:MAG: glycosyltransferase, partial [Ktedonobacterales bacterium]